jgi:hypothetical protein
MNSQEQARELMTQQRQEEEHLHESMLNRAETEVDNSSDTQAVTQEQARELMTQQRHREEHLHESLLSRAEAELT